MTEVIESCRIDYNDPEIKRRLLRGISIAEDPNIYWTTVGMDDNGGFYELTIFYPDTTKTTKKTLTKEQFETKLLDNRGVSLSTLGTELKRIAGLVAKIFELEQILGIKNEVIERLQEIFSGAPKAKPIAKKITTDA